MYNVYVYIADFIYYNVIPKGPEYIWENADLNDEKNHSVIISMQNVVNYDNKHSRSSGTLSRERFFQAKLLSLSTWKRKFQFNHTVGVELYNL